MIETAEECEGDVEQLRTVLAEEHLNALRVKFGVLTLSQKVNELYRLGLLSSEERAAYEKACYPLCSS